jgi:hypothetical protein
MNKQFFISLLFALLTFVILGGLFGNFVFLPEFATWHEAYPDAVRETPDFVSGLVLGLLQLIALRHSATKTSNHYRIRWRNFWRDLQRCSLANDRPSNGLCNQYRIVRLRSKRRLIVRSNGCGLRISHYLVAKKVRLENAAISNNKRLVRLYRAFVVLRQGVMLVY